MGELSLIFVGGLLGSSHCLGMCGGFALLLGSNRTSRRDVWVAQLLYSAGRIFTYTVLGTIAGFIGMRLGHSLTSWVNASAILSLVAGLFLIVQGLKAAGIRLWKSRLSSNSQGCLASPLFKTFFQSRSRSSQFLAGVATGFLPCGLLYGFLALATASQDIISGTAIMAAFGLGTTPMMMLAGIGGQLLSGITRLRLLRVAAWCVVLTGGITAYRGVAFFRMEHAEIAPTCPFCSTPQHVE